MIETGGQGVAASVTGALTRIIQGGSPVTLHTRETATGHQAPPLAGPPRTEREALARGGMMRSMTVEGARGHMYMTITMREDPAAAGGMMTRREDTDMIDKTFHLETFLV